MYIVETMIEPNVIHRVSACGQKTAVKLGFSETARLPAYKHNATQADRSHPARCFTALHALRRNGA
jgi:hypothetical protein